jgi:hypothetical protein
VNPVTGLARCPRRRHAGSRHACEPAIAALECHLEWPVATRDWIRAAVGEIGLYDVDIYAVGAVVCHGGANVTAAVYGRVCPAICQKGLHDARVAVQGGIPQRSAVQRGRVRATVCQKDFHHARVAHAGSYAHRLATAGGRVVTVACQKELHPGHIAYARGVEQIAGLNHACSRKHVWCQPGK